MNSSEFLPPPKTRMGPGCRSELGELVSDGDEVHVVTDSGVVEAGLVSRISAALPTDPVVHDGIKPNPDVDSVLRLSSELSGADLVVGIGGGSPMDATKAACTLPGFDDQVRAELAVTPDTPVVNPSRTTPFVLVPTTAGTGTETGYWAVITDHDREMKASIGHPEMLARRVFLDPELTTSLPPKLTASTGFDVIAHAIESLVADGASEFTVPYSRRGYSLAIEALVPAVTDGTDLAARSRMLQASYLAGVAMNNAGLGAAHAISHALGGRYDLPHGHTNALLLPAVVRKNGARSPLARQRYGSVTSSITPAHEALAERLSRLRSTTGLATSPPGAPDPSAVEWSGVSERAVDNINMRTNPVAFDRDDVTDVGQGALGVDHPQ